MAQLTLREAVLIALAGTADSLTVTDISNRAAEVRPRPVANRYTVIEVLETMRVEGYVELVSTGPRKYRFNFVGKA